MEPITLRAHIDGKQILLDEPCPLPLNAKLVIAVLPDPLDEERDDWARLPLQNLARAYGPDEPEYSLDDIKEVNPDYEAR